MIASRNDDVRDLPTQSLEDLLHECSKVIETVCTQLRAEEEMVAIVRLMRSDDLLEAFLDFASKNRQMADRILNASPASLVNTQSVLAITSEVQHRESERN